MLVPAQAAPHELRTHSPQASRERCPAVCRTELMKPDAALRQYLRDVALVGDAPDFFAAMGRLHAGRRDA